MELTDEKKRNGNARDRDLVGGPAVHTAGLGGDVSQNMLVEIFRAVPRMQAQLEHIEESVDSTRRNVETLGRKVEDLTCWKNRILGGVAVVAFLWGGLKLLSDYVHVSVGRDAARTSIVAPVD